MRSLFWGGVILYSLTSHKLKLELLIQIIPQHLYVKFGVKWSNLYAFSSSGSTNHSMAPVLSKCLASFSVNLDFFYFLWICLCFSLMRGAAHATSWDVLTAVPRATLQAWEWHPRKGPKTPLADGRRRQSLEVQQNSPVWSVRFPLQNWKQVAVVSQKKMYYHVVSTLALSHTKIKMLLRPSAQKWPSQTVSYSRLAWSCPKIFRRTPSKESPFRGTIVHCSTMTSPARNSDTSR